MCLFASGGRWWLLLLLNPRFNHVYNKIEGETKNELNPQQSLISCGCLLSPANVMFGLKVEQCTAIAQCYCQTEKLFFK